MPIRVVDIAHARHFLHANLGSHKSYYFLVNVLFAIAQKKVGKFCKRPETRESKSKAVFLHGFVTKF